MNRPLLSTWLENWQGWHGHPWSWTNKVSEIRRNGKKFYLQDFMASANFIMISQKGKKMQNKRRKNSMVKGCAKPCNRPDVPSSWDTRSNGRRKFSEKNLWECEPPGKGWPSITHFQNTLYAPCTTVPKRFLLDIFHWGARVSWCHDAQDNQRIKRDWCVRMSAQCSMPLSWKCYINICTFKLVSRYFQAPETANLSDK